MHNPRLRKWFENTNSTVVKDDRYVKLHITLDNACFYLRRWSGEKTHGQATFFFRAVLLAAKWCKLFCYRTHIASIFHCRITLAIQDKTRNTQIRKMIHSKLDSICILNMKQHFFLNRFYSHSHNFHLVAWVKPIISNTFNVVLKDRTSRHNVGWSIFVINMKKKNVLLATDMLCGALGESVSVNWVCLNVYRMEFFVFNTNFRCCIHFIY